MTMITNFRHQTTIPLYHSGDCSILALTPDGSLYIEEYYEENYIAQHQIRNNKIVQSIDEDAGQRDIVPFKLPDSLIIPHRPLKHPLNFQGLRFRGLREEEQIQDWLQPLSVMEKMPLLSALAWSLPAMMLLGIAESAVLAEVQINGTALLCRRLRLAYALQRRLDEAGIPYDYDTRIIYLLHHYSEEIEISLHQGMMFAGIALQRPMDLLYDGSRLILADGAGENTKSRVIIWEKAGD